jgi:hypothetical protein
MTRSAISAASISALRKVHSLWTPKGPDVATPPRLRDAACNCGAPYVLADGATDDGQSLVEREGGTGRFVLTDQGRAVLAALLRAHMSI